MPIDVDHRCSNVRYVDSLTVAEIEERFPELSGHSIVPTDVICDVVSDGLHPFSDGSLDFIIACHLLEHLPNPLGFLKECHRVLRNSGILYLAVPDKNYTFDRDRQRTSLAHLIEDLEGHTLTVDESHLVDFLVHAAKQAIPEVPRQRKQLFQRHLDRSIHVHVWTWEDVAELLRFMLTGMGVKWELCEVYLPKGVKDESIFVLRKTNLRAETVIQHFDASLELLITREQSAEAFIRAFQEAVAEKESLLERRQEALDLAVHELIAVRAQLQGALDESRRELTAVRAQLQGALDESRRELTAVRAQLQGALDESRRELTAVRQSLGYRLLKGYRRPIRWLFPPGSWRGLPYRALLRMVRSLLDLRSRRKHAPP
ncbi:MAG: methyltransferase domain-containing protein [Chloroflexi bacterium]|nr:methyltransferase domain-containing protein [Chloroflexota bacterium]